MSFVPNPARPLTVVGIGAEGWAGLGDAATSAVTSAEVLLGGRRHLDLVGEVSAVCEPWPSPLLPGLDELLERYRESRVCILASGDPLLSGIGGTLVRRFGSEALRIIPTVSSVTLARARLGWTAEECEVLSTLGRDITGIRAALGPGRKLLVLSTDEHTPASVAELLSSCGYGDSRLTVLEQLGSDSERLLTDTAHDWSHTRLDALNVLAIECSVVPGTRVFPNVAGLPDDAFEHDGQITRRALRAHALAVLAPCPGELLWDVGSGSGSVAVEWCRAHPANRAVAIERDPVRRTRIERNARHFGITGLDVRAGSAPDVLTELPPPDAVFLGGGVSTVGVLRTCWDALPPGGRIAANGVTVEAETTLTQAYAAHGGELTRMALERAEPLGSFTGWTPERTVIQWHTSKGDEQP